MQSMKKIKYSAAIKAHFNLIEKLSSVQRLIFVGVLVTKVWQEQRLARDDS